MYLSTLFHFYFYKCIRDACFFKVELPFKLWPLQDCKCCLAHLSTKTSADYPQNTVMVQVFVPVYTRLCVFKITKTSKESCQWSLLTWLLSVFLAQKISWIILIYNGLGPNLVTYSNSNLTNVRFHILIKFVNRLLQIAIHHLLVTGFKLSKVQPLP